MRIFLAALLCLVVFSFAYTEECDRKCVDQNENLIFEELPDSFNVSLQEKLQKDTSFIFFGSVKNSTWLAYAGEEFETNDSITVEDKQKFSAWIESINNESSHFMDSIPEDLKTSFQRLQIDANYLLIKVDFHVEKIYNRKSKAWENATKNEKEFSKKFFIRNNPFIKKNPLRLLREFFIRPYYERIFFEDGFSRILDVAQLDSLEKFASLPKTFLPYKYQVELHKDMSSEYKAFIKKSLMNGDKESLRYYKTMLDSFIVQSEGKYFESTPSTLSCQTKRLLSVYTETFDDQLNCNDNLTRIGSDERIIYTMLVDSIKAMRQNKALEKSLTEYSSGDRAFWRALTGALFAKDQNELNNLIKSESDSIKKTDQKEFLYKQFYKEITTSKLTAEILMGGGIQAAAGDAADHFKVRPAYAFSLEFFGEKFGGGYVGRGFTSKKDNEKNYLDAFLIDLYFGYKTFIFPHVENRIFFGPTLTFTDLKNDDSEDNDPIDSDFNCGIYAGTAFDFYPTAPNLDELSNAKLRFGIRLQAGASTYSTDLVDGAKGISFHVNISLLMQAYETRLKEFGK